MGTHGLFMDVVPEESIASIEAVDGVHLKLLASGDEANIQHFFIEPGASVPEHSHPHEQLGVIKSGTLTFMVGGQEHHLSSGDTYHLDSGESHGAENRGDVPVVGYDVFSPPRDDPDWRE